jgi:hypothetical protein
MNIGHAGFDKPVELKLVTALGDLDGPQLTGPAEDVLKEVAVDRAEVSEVEDAGRNAFTDALNHQPSLNQIEPSWVADI